jgi:uncharacterized membrane protein YagU involved in acid resistance
MRFPPRGVLIGGLLAGVLDIAAALTFWGVKGVAPARILQAIASGLLGREAAFAGGAGTAALGLLLHFAIAFGAAGVYHLATRRWPALLRHWVVSGIVYGVVVYLVMEKVVLPLSRGGFRGSAPEVMAIMVLIHMVCVGLPIAWGARAGARAGAGIVPAVVPSI